jgi:hypothetical protein
MTISNAAETRNTVTRSSFKDNSIDLVFSSHHIVNVVAER